MFLKAHCVRITDIILTLPLLTNELLILPDCYLEIRAAGSAIIHSYERISIFTGFTPVTIYFLSSVIYITAAFR